MPLFIIYIILPLLHLLSLFTPLHLSLLPSSLFSFIFLPPLSSLYAVISHSSILPLLFAASQHFTNVFVQRVSAASLPSSHSSNRLSSLGYRLTSMGRDGNFSDSSGTEDGDSQAQTRQQSHANSQSLSGGKSLEARAHRSTSSIFGITVIPEDTFGTENKHAQSLFPRSDFRPKASDDTFIAGEDSNSSRPSRRPLADISATANRTPTSAGIVSEFSTPAELSFGPQSLPFMLRKRELVNEGTPSKTTSTATVTDLSKDPIEPSTSTQFFGRQQLVLDHYSESHEIQRSSVNYGTHLHQSSVDHGNKPLSEKKLTSWRRDQIKKAKQPELILASTPKPIPTLYGPLSLPYARNPR